MYEFHIPLVLVLLAYMSGSGFCYILYSLTALSGEMSPTTLSYHQECVATVFAIFWIVTLPFYGAYWLWRGCVLGRDFLSTFVANLYNRLNK